MKTKEEKFWAALRDLSAREAEAGAALQAVFAGTKDPADGYAVVKTAKRDVRESFETIAERMYKAYKEPASKDRARGILFRAYQVLNDLKDTLGLMRTLSMDGRPEELVEMAELAAASLLEMEKIMAYTVDVDANYMKMEARCRKIYTYEERGDTLRAACLRALFTSDQPAGYILYWKEILDHMENVLDHVAGMIPLLQKLLVHE